jgi:hypothetical protein
MNKARRFLGLFSTSVLLACVGSEFGRWSACLLTTKPFLWVLVGLGIWMMWGMFMSDKKGGE